MSNKKRQVTTKGSVHRKGNNHWCMCPEGRQRRSTLDVYQVGRWRIPTPGEQQQRHSCKRILKHGSGRNTRGVLGHRGKSCPYHKHTKGSRQGEGSQLYQSALKTTDQNGVKITKACGNSTLEARGPWVSVDLQVATLEDEMHRKRGNWEAARVQDRPQENSTVI